jgi:hypothetical protein
LPEVSHLLQDGNYPDVTLKGYPANCSSGYVSNEMVLEMVAKNLNSFSKIIVVTSACRGNKNINRTSTAKLKSSNWNNVLKFFTTCRPSIILSNRATTW